MYRELVARLVQEIDADTSAERKRTGREPLGEQGGSRGLSEGLWSLPWDWPDGIWSDRYTAIPVSDEPAAQVDRLRYVLAQGVKEGLVATGAEPLGPQAILSQHPHTRSAKLKKSPAPLFHAASKEAARV